MHDGGRRFRPMARGVHVVFREIALGRPARRYLASLAGGLAPCGAFVPTVRPLRPGRVASMELHLPGEPPVRATAVVRWRCRWSTGRGMAVEIVEVDGLGGRRLEDWLERALACREMTRRTVLRLDLSGLGRRWLERAGIAPSLLPASGYRPDAGRTT